MISKSNVKFRGDVAWMVESLLEHTAFVLITLKPCVIKQLLDSVLVISSLIKVSVSVISASADNTYLDLDYSRYHKNLIQ